MKILITNDDGICAEGIKHLINFGKKLGDVIVAAPKYEQSAKSHALNIKTPFSCVEKDLGYGVRTIEVDSSPADCVRYVHYGLQEKIDLVLSGINFGYNVGEDIMYSATVAAACEAATLGINAIAISSGRDGFYDTEEYLMKIWKYINENKLFDIWGLYNINFPSKSFSNQEIIITEQGNCNFQTTFEKNENIYYQKGIPCFESSIDKMHLDTAAIMNNKITITPLVYNRTNYEILKKLHNK